MHDDDFDIVHIHPSLMRPVTHMGMERNLAILVVGFSFLSFMTAVVILQNDRAAALGFALFGLVLALGGIPLVQWMTHADPLMRRLALRHLVHQEFYPAWSHLTGRRQKPRKRTASS